MPNRPNTRFVVRMQLNQQLMRTRRLTPPGIRRILTTQLGTRAHVVSSEVNDVHWVVRIRFYHIDEMVAHAHMPLERQAVLSQRVMSVLLKTLLVSGHPDVHSATVRSETVHTMHRDGDMLEPRLSTERVVDAVGHFLSDVAAAPMVDWTRCFTNDIVEVQSTLGISAAAEVLYSELREVIQFDGTYVFSGHLSLIVDTMTRDGYLKPLNRFGVNREHVNALSRSSYEETPDILTEAAIFAEDTAACGVSTSIILGQRAHIGTGVVDVRFNESMLPQHMSRSMHDGLVKSIVRSSNREVDPSHIEYFVHDECEEDVKPRDTTTADLVQPPYDQTNDSLLQMQDTHHREFASVPPGDNITFRLHSPPPPEESETEDEADNVSVFTQETCKRRRR